MKHPSITEAYEVRNKQSGIIASGVGATRRVARTKQNKGKLVPTAVFSNRSHYSVSASSAFFVILVISLISLSGCARQKVVTQKAALNYGQFTLRQLPPDIDLSALKGKRIVIDPGHGGSFGGATGPNNLREADVNLGVGLYLWGMLTQAGAEAYLTRMDDSNVYQGDDFDLKKDLQARVEFAMAHEAELFVSLHHNADVLPGKKKNSLETYFKMSDFGPSLDLAQYVHKQLALSLHQPENSVLPGNYHVLREFPGPAVLGEPSYISHEDNSFKLGLAPMQRIEAQAYFLGIAEYFSEGVPKIKDIQPADSVPTAQPLVTARVAADRGVPIDPGSVEVRLDGKTVEAVFDPASSQIKYLPEQPLNNGIHRLRFSLRNVNGNAAETTRAEFLISRPSTFILLDANLRAFSPTCREPVRVTAKILDADASPVANGTAVTFTTDSGTISPTVAFTRDGVAAAYLTPAGTGEEKTVTVSARADGLSHAVKLYARNGAGEFSVITALDAKTQKPVQNALMSVDNLPLGYSDSSGYFAFSHTSSSQSGFISARGYIPRSFAFTPSSTAQIAELQPIANGLLSGKRFALDPQFGGEEKGETGPTGVRASDLNLRVARYLAGFLRAAGAEAVLTREADLTITPLRRVETAEQFGAQWFVSIGHGDFPRRTVTGEEYTDEQQISADARVMHYPTSQDGQRLARAIAAAVQNEGIAQNPLIEPASDFVLTHTSSPAVVVSLPGPASAATEERLREPETARREAYAIYCALVENLGLTDEQTGGLQVQILGNAESAHALITVDGAVTRSCTGECDITFRDLTPGEHHVEVVAREQVVCSEDLLVRAGQTTNCEIALPPEIPVTGGTSAD